jgi:hypothetical protein
MRMPPIQSPIVDYHVLGGGIQKKGLRIVVNIA